VRADDVVLLCSDGLTSMISEKRIAEILESAESLQRAADQLIDEANAAGGRDNITVVLFRLEEVGTDAQLDQPTMVGAAAPPATGASQAAETPETPAAPAAPASVLTQAPPSAETKAAAPAAKVPLARTQGRPPTEREGGRRRRFIKPLAALVSIVIVLGLIGAGGYLASRQLYFLGTNGQGIVTVYRGFPYELPGGIHLYETYYTSGVPAADIPPARRAALLNHKLRSQADATSLINTLELGQLSQ
jgi:protein phosphatase